MPEGNEVLCGWCKCRCKIEDMLGSLSSEQVKFCSLDCANDWEDQYWEDQRNERMKQNEDQAS